MYEQLEFDFTWFVFCDLVDNETGEVIGGCTQECTASKLGYSLFLLLRDDDMWDFTPYHPVIHDYYKVLYKIYR